MYRPRSVAGLIAVIAALSVACGGAAPTTAPASNPPTASSAPTTAPSATPAASAPSSPTTGDWVVVTPDGGGFTVEMPGQATFQTQTAETALGPIELHIATFTTASGAYFATWSDYPAGSITDPAASLIGARDGAVRNINGTLVSDGPVSREGLEGHALTATVAGGTYQAEIYLDGDRMIQLGIASADGATVDPERFFSSFTLTG